jgi:hypothetical protein
LSARDSNLEDVQQLLDPPEPVNPNEAFGDDYGYALHAAFANGHVAVVQSLLESGADIDAQGGTLDYALHFAAYNGYTFVVKLLLAWCLRGRTHMAQTPLYRTITSADLHQRISRKVLEEVERDRTMSSFKAKTGSRTCEHIRREDLEIEGIISM